MATDTSSLTSEVSLTRIYEESDLQTAHTSRHTKTGLLVDGPLLGAYIPTPPTKRGVLSWVWAPKEGKGEGITRKNDGEKL